MEATAIDDDDEIGAVEIGAERATAAGVAGCGDGAFESPFVHARDAGAVVVEVVVACPSSTSNSNTSSSASSSTFIRFIVEESSNVIPSSSFAPASSPVLFRALRLGESGLLGPPVVVVSSAAAFAAFVAAGSVAGGGGGGGGGASIIAEEAISVFTKQHALPPPAGFRSSQTPR